jgi:hypothetical protein
LFSRTLKFEMISWCMCCYIEDVDLNPSFEHKS